MAYDKAKWHFDADDFPAGLPIEQGGVHMAFFFRWMLENGFAGEDLLADAADEVAGVQAGDYSALTLLFDFCDGVLLDEDFSEDGAAFADAYYADDGDFVDQHGGYLQNYSTLALSHLPGLEDSDYGIEFSDANYALVKAAIDQRFQTFQRVKTD